MSYGVFAEFYDALTLNVDYSERARYLTELCERLGKPMGLTLDLACGTGSLTLELKKAGVDVYGADGSEDMLAVANEKAFEEGLGVLFLCQKMQEIDLYGTIDCCVCTLDSINHLTNIADVQKVFDRVSLFMNPGGLFVFDVNTVYKHQSILGNNTFVYDTDEVFCVWQNSLKENNIVNIDLSFFIPEGEMYCRSDESFRERAYTHGELCEMLEKAGFRLRGYYGDMSFEKPLEDEQRVIYAAEKK